MLFITNRALKQSRRSRAGRNIDFDLNNTQAEQSVYFCRREAEGKYTELTSRPFLEEFKDLVAEQVLVFIHGFSNLPEPHIFPRAQALQRLFDDYRKDMVVVVPLIWPCDNDLGILKDYWDDQKAADASAFAFARVLNKFIAWRNRQENAENPCLKRINVLSHSMGNRVLRETLHSWAYYDFPTGVPLILRNTFMVAADVVNESLEREQKGIHVCQASRNVTVYFASDDLALRASKASNLKNRIASRRLGHTGPEDMGKVPGNVYAVDCDNLNTRYDTPTGHSYFLYDQDGEKGGKPGEVFKHICHSLDAGRVLVEGDIHERVHMLR